MSKQSKLGAKKLHNIFKEKPIIFILGVNTFFLLISLFLFHPSFETNDDSIMALIAEGAYGSRSSFLIFINIIYGSILRFFYEVFPGIRWYTVFFVIILFLSFIAITYVFVYVNTDNKNTGKYLSVIFLLCFFYEGYVQLQFTKVGAIAAAAGYLLIFHALRQKKLIKKQIIAGVFLALVGSMVRIDSFFAITLFMFGIGVYEVFGILKGIEGKNRIIALIKEIRNYIIVFLILFLTVFTAKGIHDYVYSADKEWKEYTQYNLARSKVVDYNKLNWNTYAEEYKRIDVSENDIYSYNTWQLAATDTFNVELMNQLWEIPDKTKIDTKLLKDFAALLYSFFFEISGFVAVMLVVLLTYALFFSKRHYLILIYELGLFCFLQCYYHYQGRLNHRIFVLFWLGAFLPILYYMCTEESAVDTGSLIKILLIPLCMGAFLSCGLYFKNTTEYLKQKRETKSNVHTFYEEISRDKEHIYLTDNFSDFSCYAYDAFRYYPEGYFDNLTSFGTWMTTSPVSNRVWEKYNIENPYRAAYELENAYVIDNSNIENKIIYIKEHYQKDVKAELISNEYGFKVYKLREK